jgi:hypothetical protein
MYENASAARGRLKISMPGRASEVPNTLGERTWCSIQPMIRSQTRSWRVWGGAGRSQPWLPGTSASSSSSSATATYVNQPLQDIQAPGLTGSVSFLPEQGGAQPVSRPCDTCALPAAFGAPTHLPPLRCVPWPPSGSRRYPARPPPRPAAAWPPAAPDPPASPASLTQASTRPSNGSLSTQQHANKHVFTLFHVAAVP